MDGWKDGVPTHCIAPFDLTLHLRLIVMFCNNIHYLELTADRILGTQNIGI